MSPRSDPSTRAANLVYVPVRLLTCGPVTPVFLACPVAELLPMTLVPAGNSYTTPFIKKLELLCVVEKEDSPLEAVLVNTYTAKLFTAEVTSVQPVGVEQVTPLATIATSWLPLVAAVKVQVCELVPFSSTELPDNTVRYSHCDMLTVYNAEAL